MARQIHLTWLKDGKVVEEDCFLITEDDVVTVITGDEAIDLAVPDLSRIISDIDDYVMFEDEFGVFGVPPADVIKIEPREN